MRSIRHLAVALCLLPLLAALPATALAQGDNPAFIPGEVVIGWQPVESAVPASREGAVFDVDRSTPAWQAAARALVAQAGLQVADVQPEYGTALLSVPAGQEVAEITRLRKLPWVAYAELNYVARAVRGCCIPERSLIWRTVAYAPHLRARSLGGHIGQFYAGGSCVGFRG